MTMFDEGIPGASRQLGHRRKVPDAVALGRWINPALWTLAALVFTGYLIIGHPATTVVTTFLSTPAGQDELARSSMTDVLNAALGTALAAGWLIAGAWVGIRSARIPLDEPQSVIEAPWVRKNRK